jgi:hypothetical protein
MFIVNQFLYYKMEDIIGIIDDGLNLSGKLKLRISKRRMRKVVIYDICHECKNYIFRSTNKMRCKCGQKSIISRNNFISKGHTVGRILQKLKYTEYGWVYESSIYYHPNTSEFPRCRFCEKYGGTLLYGLRCYKCSLNPRCQVCHAKCRNVDRLCAKCTENLGVYETELQELLVKNLRWKCSICRRNGWCFCVCGDLHNMLGTGCSIICDKCHEEYEYGLFMCRVMRMDYGDDVIVEPKCPKCYNKKTI